MPMSFPDMNSLIDAARVWKFREMQEGESEEHYRHSLADFVKPKDLIESQEIRTGKGWDQWDQLEGAQLLSHAGVIRTRAEHLAWAKERALEYVTSGDPLNAIASMLSDLGKHPETERSVAMGAVISLTVNRRDPESVRRFIEGFN